MRTVQAAAEFTITLVFLALPPTAGTANAVSGIKAAQIGSTKASSVDGLG
ncbi:MAG: hypothetical protein ACXWVZ_06310 [Kaistella sp.]